MAIAQKKPGSGKVIPILPASRVESFAQCERRAWLETHRPELAVDAEDAAYWQLQAEAVNKAAQRQFAGAFTIQENFEEGLAMTRTLMSRHPSGTFFDTSFLAQQVHVRPDVLECKSKGIIVSEITAGTIRGQKLDKDKHARFTARLGLAGWALAQKKLKPVQYAVHALDRDTAWDGKDPTYQGLLTRVDMTEAAVEARRAVPSTLTKLRQTLASSTEPKVKVSRHCKKPFVCPFMAHCKSEAGRPAVTIYDIPGKYWQVQDRWAEQGYYDLSKVPAEELEAAPFELQPVIQSVLTRTEWKSKDAAKMLAQLPFPRYYFDFEAISLALPAWKDRRPYEQVPFQWSVHIETAPGKFTHKAFVDLSGKDPAQGCAQSLIRALGKSGPVLVYHKAYESSRLKEMAERFPKLGQALLAVEARLVDLEVWVRDTYYHPEMQGSYSIKKVLPCLAPEFDYAQLDGVRNGVDAQFAYLSAIGGGFDRSLFLQTRNRLLDYCAHDTWAMVAVAYRLANKNVPERCGNDKRPAGVNSFSQARVKAAFNSQVWQLWEQERPTLEAQVQWDTLQPAPAVAPTAAPTVAAKTKAPAKTGTTKTGAESAKKPASGKSAAAEKAVGTAVQAPSPRQVSAKVTKASKSAAKPAGKAPVKATAKVASKATLKSTSKTSSKPAAKSAPAKKASPRVAAPKTVARMTAANSKVVSRPPAATPVAPSKAGQSKTAPAPATKAKAKSAAKPVKPAAKKPVKQAAAAPVKSPVKQKLSQTKKPVRKPAANAKPSRR